MTFTTTETSKQNSTTTDNSSPLHHDDTEDSSTAPDTSRFQRDEREKFSNFYNGNRRNLNSGYGVTASRYSRGSHGRPHKNLRDTSLYREIRSKKNNDEYKTMYLQFSYDDILSLTKNLPATPEYESILKKAYESAESRKTKKTIEEQYDIRKKYQPTHGLVFKNIPKNTVRQDLFDAILAIPLMKKKDGEPRWTEHDFPGKCQMRSFMYPQKISSGDTRNAFPVFVDQRDRQTILNSIQDKNDRFNLPMKSKHSDDEVRSIQLIVEEVRGAEGSSDNKESNSNDNKTNASDNQNNKNNNNNNDQLTNSQHQKLNPRAQGFMPNNGQYQPNPVMQNQMNYLPNNYHPGLYGQGYVNDVYNPYHLQQQHQQTLTQFHRSNKFSNPNSVVNSGYEANKNPNTNSRRLEFKKPNEDQENNNNKNNNNNKSSQPHTPQPNTNNDNTNNNQTVSMNGSNIIINNDINHRFDDTTGRDLSGASSPMSFTSNNSSNFQEQVLGQNKVFRPLNLKINNNSGSVQTAVPNNMMDLFSNMNDQYTIGGNNMLASGTSSMGRDPQFSPFLVGWG